MTKASKIVSERKAAVRACQIELSLKAKTAPHDKKCAVRKSIMAKLKMEGNGGNPQDAPPELSHA